MRREGRREREGGRERDGGREIERDGREEGMVSLGSYYLLK